MSPPKAPCLLKPSYQMDQLWVVPQLGVHNLHILRIPLNEQSPQVMKAFLDVLA